MHIDFRRRQYWFECIGGIRVPEDQAFYLCIVLALLDAESDQTQTSMLSILTDVAFLERSQTGRPEENVLPRYRKDTSSVRRESRNEPLDAKAASSSETQTVEAAT